MKRLAVLVVVLGLFLTACTEKVAPVALNVDSLPEAAGSPSNHRDDPCRLVTRAEITAALGISVASPIRLKTLFYLLTPQGVPAWACDFAMLGSLSGKVRVRSTRDRARKIFDAIKPAGLAVESLPGAVWQSPGSALWLYREGVIVVVEVPLMRGGAPAVDVAIAIARRIGGRL